MGDSLLVIDSDGRSGKQRSIYVALVGTQTDGHGHGICWLVIYGYFFVLLGKLFSTLLFFYSILPIQFSFTSGVH
jgi:hypothetical protein